MRELLDLMQDWSGYQVLSEARKGPNHAARVAATLDLLTNARGVPQHRHKYELVEAMTTSDFPFLFGEVLDRQMLASYQAVPPVWKAFVKHSTNKNFLNSFRFAVYGGDQYLAPVDEKGEYLASTRNELRYILAVIKYGRQFDISWESLVNDDLGALRDTPERFARAATRTEHRLVTAAYAGDVGAHVEGAGGNLYEVGINASANGLSIANLETALENQAALTDIGGEPILNRSRYLIVPPALEMTAKQILASPNKMWVDHVTRAADSGATFFPMPTTNVIPQMSIDLIIDPYLPILDATSGSVGWYLFSDPTNLAALEVAHLEGHERPEICMKASNKVSMGGGPISPMEGDFETDNVFYRVRICFGVTALDWRGTYMGGYAG